MPASLTSDDLMRVLRVMPKDARTEMMRQAKAQRPVIFLAGGAIRAVIANEPVHDWDFFGGSAIAVEKFVGAIKAKRHSLPCRIYQTQNAATLLTLGHSVIQGVTRWAYSDADVLLREFDFTVAQAVIWCDANCYWQSMCADAFYPDLAAKRLVYTEPVREEDAGGSMLRVMKFVRRGYTISPEELAKVMARLFTAVGTGQGATPTQIIAGLLREVDPLARIDGLELAQDGESLTEGSEDNG